MRKFRGVILGFVACVIVIGALSLTSFAQNTRSRTAGARPTPTPVRTEPEVISRADQYIDENGRVVTPVVVEEPADEPLRTSGSEGTISDLDQRIRSLETGRKDDSAEKQRRLALNLEILTKAEQRVESLRKQYFDMVEKESEIQQRLDTIEIEIRPDQIERNVAFAGSLRPEQLREARQRNLAAERTKLQTLMAEVQRNKANLDVNLQRADQLVDRLRTRLEKEIDDALDADEPAERP